MEAAMHPDTTAARRRAPAGGRPALRPVATGTPFAPAGADTVEIFDADPDLLEDLDSAAAELLRRRVTVPKLWVDEGAWEPPTGADGRGWLGLLVLDGLMIRSLHVGDRECPELVGAGDLLRPWDADDDSSVPASVSWTSLERSTVAVLDERFAGVVCRFPALMANLLSRSVRRSGTLAFHLAIAQIRHAETRLHLLLWHLADRWGHVTPAGVHVPLALTHETLAHLVCMRRPTASTALQRLRRAGDLDRRPDGTWLLTGSPPAGERG